MVYPTTTTQPTRTHTPPITPMVGTSVLNLHFLVRSPQAPSPVLLTLRLCYLCNPLFRGLHSAHTADCSSCVRRLRRCSHSLQQDGAGRGFDSFFLFLLLPLPQCVRSSDVCLILLRWGSLELSRRQANILHCQAPRFSKLHQPDQSKVFRFFNSNFSSFPPPFPSPTHQPSIFF